MTLSYIGTIIMSELQEELQSLFKQGYPLDQAIIINISYKENTKMDFNLCEIKEAKSPNLEETQSVPTDKLIANLQECSSVEYKLEKALNQNEKFQINSLALTQQLHNSQRLQSNSESGCGKMEIEAVPLENSKVEGKQIKRKKIISLDSIFKSYRVFAGAPQAMRKRLSFSEYARKRTNVFPNSQNLKTDLGIYNIREIVQFCSNKNILSTDVYAQYTFQPCFAHQEQFIEKMDRQLYDRIDFDKMYLTPLDHRLLCKILVSLFPEQFQFPTQVTLENKKLTTFYSYLYSLTENEYSDLISNLNKKYNRAWMPSFDNDFEAPSYVTKEYKPRQRFSQTPILISPPRKLRKKY